MPCLAGSRAGLEPNENEGELARCEVAWLPMLDQYTGCLRRRRRGRGSQSMVVTERRLDPERFFVTVVGDKSPAAREELARPFALCCSQVTSYTLSSFYSAVYLLVVG